ncbi:polysaccharide deacetylase family protein [Porcipelethomonas sp.]|uniref:polysaccharide deacetylase family protein n=1 Tax=Porcipelethomonas sp. TaxID=2981675 RepID=UPI003EF4D785
MKIKKIIAAAAIITALTAGQPVQALSSEKKGYGQGTVTDSENCPVGAADFNSQYGELDAYALTNDKNRIILTFDQGYENGYTAPILDVLKEKNVKAIFFLTGDYAKKEEDLVKRMIDEGHIIGNHGMTHASMPELSDEELKEEVMSLHNFVLEKYGYEMQYLRPPCGEFSEKSLAECKELGYKTLMWSFAYVDWKTDAQPEYGQALERIVSSAHGGGIYLLHSVSSTNAAVLGEVIDKLRAEGFEL